MDVHARKTMAATRVSSSILMRRAWAPALDAVAHERAWRALSTSGPPPSLELFPCPLPFQIAVACPVHPHVDNRRLELVGWLAVSRVELVDAPGASNSSAGEKQLAQIEDALRDGAHSNRPDEILFLWPLQTLNPSPGQTSSHPRAHVTSQQGVPIMSRGHV